MNAEPEASAESLPAIASRSAAAFGPAASVGVAWAWIALLGFGHLVVDCACSYALTCTLDATDLAAGAVFAYNAVAFWGQPFLGLAADRWRLARVLAAGGALLLVAGLASPGTLPWLTVALIAAGNACYHVGGGVLAIRLSRSLAPAVANQPSGAPRAPTRLGAIASTRKRWSGDGCSLWRGRLGGLGLFVGPGAFGLVLGVGLARMDFVATPWVLGAVLLVLAVALWRTGGSRSLLQDDPLGVRSNPAVSQCRAVRAEAAHYAQAADGRTSVDADRLQAGSYSRTSLLVALVLACIAIRAFVGTGFAFEWGGSAVVAMALGAALAGGKIAGGFLADRFGWLRSTVAVLVLSVPALWFGRMSMPAGLAGVGLFQAPMAVTHGALVWALRRRPGLAFGLAAAAVYAGGFPLLAGQVPWLHSFVGLSCLSLTAVVMLAAGLRRKDECWKA